MPRRKTWKFKSSSNESVLLGRVSALQSSPTFPECFLKPRQSSGLLWARLFPGVLDSNDWKLRTTPDSVEEVVNVLQSLSVETRPVLCAAPCRRDDRACAGNGL